ncbi:protein phosphatase 2C 55 [Pyrus ussuriensis x Pyrus communis]|uniref:Protein phosphatase n=1 Tax=Pyrus ussuriensis x Pyrus communis TaxID=2448454 RepID=A0A5N5HL27_9ROSA|nr:protein phosphatase 2C 55 [Pyrus ussuriensis x Pyrus communis]
MLIVKKPRLEDPRFIFPEKQTIGVADGVDARAGDYAREQMMLTEATSSLLMLKFNCPYQLGNGISGDRPDSAWEECIQTIPGDIVVLGTDGLLDNMFPSEIEKVLVQGGGGDHDLDLGCGALASSIANLALYNSFDKHNPSPFSENARKAGFEHKGGKIDDITVIVAQVVAL